MAEQPKNPGDAPPLLQRVARPATPPAASPPEEAPPVLQRVARPTSPPPAEAPPVPQPVAGPASPAGTAGPAPARQPPAASRGLAAPEVTASAAIAAGLTLGGSISSQGALHLYYLAVATQASGRLTLAAEKGSYSLTFKKGVVEHAASTYPQDDLLQFLAKKGALEPAQLRQAEAVRASRGGDLVEALVESQLVVPAQTFQVLQEYGAGLAWRALATEAGTWRWEPGVPPPPSSFPLGSRWGTLCDAVRRLDGPGSRKRLGARAGRAAIRAGGRIAPSDLKLTSQETRALGLFDGTRSVEEIAQGQPADADLVYRMALLLAETELLTFGVERTTPAPPPAAAPRPSAPSPAKAPTPKAAAPPRPPAPVPTPPVRPAPAPARPAPTLQALEATYARLREADHFEVLGVTLEASAAEVKAAYFLLAKAYHPDAGLADEAPEARKLRADIFARVSEAWGVLGDPEKRAQYLEEQRSGGAAVDVMAILRAEETFQMATLLVRNRRYDEALQKLLEAIQLNPDEPEFGVWKAWVEFLLAPPQGRKARHMESAQVIEAGLEKNPRCVPGYLFLGQMAKLTGDLAAAERHLKAGLAVDEANVELQRELKHLRK